MVGTLGLIIFCVLGVVGVALFTILDLLGAKARADLVNKLQGPNERPYTIWNGLSPVPPRWPILIQRYHEKMEKQSKN